MNIIISSWYGSVNSEIKISYKVLKFLREQIMEEILKKKRILNENKNTQFYRILITSDLNKENNYLDKKKYDKKNDMFCFDFVFSISRIKKGESILHEFLIGYYNMLNDFLNEISVEDIDIKHLKAHALYELIDNEYYEYEDQTIGSDLADFAKGLGLSDE